MSLTGPEGLLKQLTKTVLETALNEELTEHLGHHKHGRADPETENIRNGTRPKTVLTESGGEVQVEVPRAAVTLVFDVDGVLAPAAPFQNREPAICAGANVGACCGLWPATGSDPPRQRRTSDTGLACVDAGHRRAVLPW